MREVIKLSSILVIINIIVWTPILFSDGIIIQRDFNFPIFPENFIRYYYPTWNDIMSQPNLEQIIRLPMRLPFLFLIKMGLDVKLILKLLIISTTVLLSVSMYLFLYKLIKVYNLNINNTTIGISSLLFAFNPVSLQFLGGISLLVSIAMLPLLLLVSIMGYKNKYKILISSFLLLLSLGHPFVFLMNIIIWALFMLTIRIRDGIDGIKQVFLVFIPTLILFTFIFLWFLLPYISNPLSSVSLGRPSHITYDTFKLVSDNSILKILVLERDKFWYVKTYATENYYTQIIHLISLVLVVSISFISIFKINRKIIHIIIFLFFGYLITTLFSLGYNSPIGEIYYSFISDLSIGWIFRSPLKFQLYQMFFIFSLFPIGVSLILDKLNIIFKYFILLSLFIGVSGYGLYDACYNSMNPIEIPKQFYEINTILGNINDPYKVMWYPRYNERPTNWSLGHKISPYDMKSSKKPTYNTFWNYNYINNILYDIPYDNELFKLDYFYNFLRSIGIKYIVFHNDVNEMNISKNYEFISEISKRSTILYYKNGWYLFSLNNDVVPPIHIKNKYIYGVSDYEGIYKFSKLDVAIINNSELKYSNMVLLTENFYSLRDDVNNIAFNNITLIYPLEAESDLNYYSATQYDNSNAQNGKLLVLGTKFKAWSNLNINKRGTYIIALKGSGNFKIIIGNKSIILKSYDMNFKYSPLIYLKKGIYNIEITNSENNYKINRINNPSFEQEFAGLPVNWDLGNSNFKIGFDKGYDGSRSLKVSTSSTVKAWSFIRSEPIEVTPGDDYLVITHMKYYNVKGSHIKVEAYYPDGGKSGTWKQLTPFIPGGKSGTSNWQEYSAIIRIPENVTKIRVVLNAGWVLDKSKGEAITWFDDIQVIPVAEAPKLDVVWLYSTDDNKTIEQLFEVKEKPAEVVNYTKVNPTLWKVKVNASKPFMLSFAEAYDPLWEARIYKDGEKVEVVRSIPLYSVINGFWINETGELEVVIRYKPQDWFEIGLAISALTFIACIGYLFYDWRRGKN